MSCRKRENWGTKRDFVTIDHTMLKFIKEILSALRSCFSRTAAYEWFVVIVVGLMVRSNHLGVTSIVRDLALDPRHYESMLHFFRSAAWLLESLQLAWYNVVNRHAPIVRFLGCVLLVSDCMKMSKEARYMPGVNKLHQATENSSKSEYIFGHFFGAIGVLAEGNHSCTSDVHIVTRAWMNAVAYEPPAAEETRAGASAKERQDGEAFDCPEKSNKKEISICLLNSDLDYLKAIESFAAQPQKTSALTTIASTEASFVYETLKLKRLNAYPCAARWRIRASRSSKR